MKISPTATAQAGFGRFHALDFRDTANAAISDHGGAHGARDYLRILLFHGVFTIAAGGFLAERNHGHTA
jgi:hypothetical protein